MEPIGININVTVELGERTVKALSRLLNQNPSISEEINYIYSEPSPQAKVEVREISDEQLKEVVDNVCRLAGPKAVRDILQSFGLTTSSECPMPRRPALVNELYKLYSL